MSLNKEFIQLLLLGVKNHHKDLMTLREYLIYFKNKGMDQESMLKNLEEIRNRNGCEMEDILLELMDFVVGYCNPNLSIF